MVQGTAELIESATEVLVQSPKLEIRTHTKTQVLTNLFVAVLFEQLYVRIAGDKFAVFRNVVCVGGYFI